MEIYTIGFTKKTASCFFELLKKNEIRKVIDIRLSNKSQLAGFAKGEDLKFFLELFGIEYVHDVTLAPTDELRKMYNDKERKMSFDEYTVIFNEIMENRQCIQKLQKLDLDKVCFLCSEEKPDKCHRKLVVDGLKSCDDNIKIIHL